jgi:hypothetical protein
MKLRPKNGSVVIVALWALVFFSMLTVSLAARIQSQISFTKRFQEERREERTACSGVSYAIGVLRKIESEKENETKGKGYFNGWDKMDFKIGYWQREGEAGGRQFIFGFQDEESKINVNTADLEVLRRLYQNGGGLSEDRAVSLAQVTVERRSRMSEFQEFGHKLGPNGAGFGSIEELLLVPGMDGVLWQKLKGHVTVYGQGLINLNSVSVQTLEALGVNESLAGRIARYREAQASALKPEDPSGMIVYNDLGDLTQKVGVSAGEIDELQNIASAWGFTSKTVRFLSGGVECVASREGRVLFLRNVS